MSIFAIGDIHGRRRALDRLLDQLPLQDEDTLVFLGDYVDRGPDSRGVIERLLALQRERGERCVCLLGNHEDMMLDHWRRTRGPWANLIEVPHGIVNVPVYGPGFWLRAGGEATLASYSDGIPDEHIAFLAGLRLRYDRDGYTFVHAGLRARGDTPRADMLWGASGFWADLDPLCGRLLLKLPDRPAPERTVVVGHTVFNRPLVGPGYIGIDTGCGFGGPLTAVRLPEMEFYQASSE